MCNFDTDCNSLILAAEPAEEWNCHCSTFRQQCSRKYSIVLDCWYAALSEKNII